MNDHNHRQNGFGSGFILGIIVGAALVFLLGIKKGKKLLKIITEEGLEGVSTLEGLFEDDFEEEEPFYAKTSKGKGRLSGQAHEESTIEKIATSGLSKVTELAETAAKAASVASDAAENAVKVTENFEKKTKRFFRGIPKKRVN